MNDLILLCHLLKTWINYRSIKDPVDKANEREMLEEVMGYE